MVEVMCYNKACGKKFDPSTNTDGSCQYHPGAPVFHDALKGWSCCKKRSTDFSEFLSIPGCTKGKHNNEKPAEPAPTPKEELPEVVIVKGPPPKGVSEAIEERPSPDAIAIPLKINESPSLKPAVEKRLAELSLQQTETAGSEQEGIRVGTTCFNTGCNQTYEDESSLIRPCHYHPGQAIFHEGMKFWSCCKKKTTDFNTFLSQPGCEKTKHLWTAPEGGQKTVDCRLDWHQTPNQVSVAVYAKAAVAERCVITANPVRLNIELVFDAGNKSFKRVIDLHRVIDPEKSSVRMLGAKVEINLKKSASCSWAKLEHVAES